MAFERVAKALINLGPKDRPFALSFGLDPTMCMIGYYWQNNLGVGQLKDGRVVQTDQKAWAFGVYVLWFWLRLSRRFA